VDTLTALLLLAALYAGACWIWPYAKCRRCGGTGKRPSPTGRTWRKCDRCKGSGERLRLGRRLLGAAPRRRL
jgi:hypothetical protein